MNYVIQKFGGTSLTHFDKRLQVIDKIKQALANGFFPIVVVSAMGRQGDPYATDSLLELLPACKHQPLITDFLMACGENISAALLAQELCSQDIKAMPFTGFQAGIITSSLHNHAEVIRVESQQLTRSIHQGIVPIVTGFQGISEDGLITTLGRGGSDTTACILGEALKASCIEIYTDVDGIMTADPKLVEEAKLLTDLFYNDAYQMAEYGAKVIHPKAVAVAMRSNIPLYVKNTCSNAPGTLITNSWQPQNSHACLATSIVNRSKALLTVLFDGSAGPLENDDQLLSLIANENLELSIVEITPLKKVFLVDISKINLFQNLLFSKGYHLEITDHCSEINILGIGENQLTKVISKTISILSTQNIPWINLSDSLRGVSCLIHQQYEKKAIDALYHQLLV